MTGSAAAPAGAMTAPGGPITAAAGATTASRDPRTAPAGPMVAGDGEVTAPADLRVVLHPRVAVRASGRVLVGGSPLRLVSLTAAGASVVAGWRDPAPVGDGHARRRLARRLLEAGMLTPLPAAAPGTADVSVVVPVRDRPAQLARCLTAIGVACPGSPVVVVDDGSARVEPVRAACAGAGARLIRHDASRGPAAARNAGLGACRTPHVLFVDSDVVLDAGTVVGLLGHLLGDPALAVVAPRLRALDAARGGLGGYERRHSALDMGPRAGLAAPGAPLAYVPSAVLLARRDALGAGFDESLRFGEDVDLVWRLVGGGWRVRYAPELHARHEHRVTLREFVAGRRRYAISAADLAARHHGALPAARLSVDLVACWVLAIGGRPRAAAAGVAWAVARRRARLLAAGRSPGPEACAVSPGVLAGAAVVRGLRGTGLALGHAVRRAWAPPLCLLGAGRPRARAALLAAFAPPVARVARDAIADGALPALPGDVALALLDEFVALAGTWEGCVRRRTLAPLLPSFVRSRDGA